MVPNQGTLLTHPSVVEVIPNGYPSSSLHWVPMCIIHGPRTQQNSHWFLARQVCLWFSCGIFGSPGFSSMAKVSTLESLACVCVCFYILIVSQLFVCNSILCWILLVLEILKGLMGGFALCHLWGRISHTLMIYTCPLNFLAFTFTLFILYIFFYNFTRGSDQISFSFIAAWPHVNMYLTREV